MLRILLVDDDDDLRLVVDRQLTSSGHHVFSAENGKVALRLIECEAVDLVITDLLMPDMDGLELITALGQMSKRPRIIAMSGGSGRLDSSYLLHVADLLKVDKVLNKPFGIAAINAAISEIFVME